MVLQPIIKNNQLDIVITPLVAVDYKGNRIGMGKGFYDRSFSWISSNKISRTTLLIGVAHDFQLIDNITPKKYDIALDYIVTPNKIINTRE